MKIRKYRPSDCKKLATLFYDTVHTINAKDYTKKQLDVWTILDLEKWNQSFQEHNTLVAVKDKKIVGFGDIDKTGYLDRLYVHKDYQGMGIATVLCNTLEQMVVVKKITVQASITAKTFFEHRGFYVVKKQKVEKQGIYFVNYVMEKDILIKRP